MITDTIYCSYVNIGKTGELDVIELWKTVWQRAGWKPVVLGIEDIEKDARTATMIQKARSMPCINGKLFETANFCRWLAFSQVNGALTDYDVFPIKPFPPKDFGGFVCGDASGGPGFIVGTKENFSKIAEDIMVYEPKPDDLTWGKPHVSDMIILHRTKARYDAILNIHRCYGTDGWKDVPLCHFGNAYLEPLNKVSKVEQVKRVLKQLCVL